MNMIANQIGIIASILTIAAFLPQVLKIWRSGDTRAISLRMYLLLCTATGLWLWFGCLIDSGPVIITNGFCLIIQLSILYLKLKQLHTFKSNSKSEEVL
jgi:MtN3 and saliva related transmembrane protein